MVPNSSPRRQLPSAGTYHESCCGSRCTFRLWCRPQTFDRDTVLRNRDSELQHLKGPWDETHDLPDDDLSGFIRMRGRQGQQRASPECRRYDIEVSQRFHCAHCVKLPSNQDGRARMKPVILLDIDGVLNPTVCPNGGGDRPLLRLSHEKRALVRRLARSGRIGWVSTWPADIVAGLEAQLELDVEPLRVTMVFRPADTDSPTPKLTSVTRWLYRMSATEESDWDSVVWIDDVLGTDARKWATEHDQPVHLEQPDPDSGLTEGHVARIEAFVARG
jgi:hypothetical protein